MNEQKPANVSAVMAATIHHLPAFLLDAPPSTSNRLPAFPPSSGSGLPQPEDRAGDNLPLSVLKRAAKEAEKAEGQNANGGGGANKRQKKGGAPSAPMAAAPAAGGGTVKGEGAATEAAVIQVPAEIPA